MRATHNQETVQATLAITITTQIPFAFTPDQEVKQPPQHVQQQNKKQEEREEGKEPDRVQVLR